MRWCFTCMSEVGDEAEQFCPFCGANIADQSVEPQFLPPGSELQDKFIVGKPIGSGGFGHTYIGWNKALLSRVAIKEYYPRQFCERLDDGRTVAPINANYEDKYREGLTGFIEEARSIAELHDIKGVVEVYSFFEENGTGYIVMEYLRGMDVKSILKVSGNTRDYDWCRRVILTVLSTLKEVHARGVIHRDIAPDNVFVTNEGIIKLIDFGAAKRDMKGSETQGEILLKHGYAPIEQYSHKSQQGPYTDIYATAALFYRMLTGKKPPAAPERARNETLLTPSQMGVAIPEEAEMAIMVCLNVRAEYRLQSAEEFMYALDGADFVPVDEPEWILPATEEEIRAEKESAGRMSKMSLGVKIAILAAILVLIGGGVVATVFLIQDRNVDVSASGVVDASSRMVQLEGTAYADVEDTLKEGRIDPSSLNIVVVEYKYDASASEETIGAQDIEPGEAITPGQQLGLTVFSSVHVTVPNDLTGVSFTEARKQITEQYGLKVVMENAGLSPGQEAGTVVSTSPVAGEVIDLTGEASITLRVSEGSADDWKVSLDGVTGKTTDQIQSMLVNQLKANAGLALFGTYLDDVVKRHIKTAGRDFSNGVAPGHVCRVTPGEGRAVNIHDDDITVTISKGPKPTPKPKPTPEPEPDDGGGNDDDDDDGGFDWNDFAL